LPGIQCFHLASRVQLNTFISKTAMALSHFLRQGGHNHSATVDSSSSMSSAPKPNTPLNHLSYPSSLLHSYCLLWSIGSCYLVPG
jgi:hypothetical protein